MKLFERFRRSARPMRLQFFMKSGHAFIVDRVTNIDVEATGNKITSLSLTQRGDHTGTALIVPTIDLSQIEAVVRLPR